MIYSVHDLSASDLSVRRVTGSYSYISYVRRKGAPISIGLREMPTRNACLDVRLKSRHAPQRTNARKPLSPIGPMCVAFRAVADETWNIRTQDTRHPS